MTAIKLEKKLFDTEGNYKTYTNDILLDGIQIGRADIIVNEEEELNYIEKIEISENYRNHGYGTYVLKELARLHDSIYLAPDNADAQRLYERLGEEWITNAPDVDQGYGVYIIEK